MKSLFTAGKLFLAGSLILLTSSLTGATASAVTPNNTSVANTDTCHAGKVVTTSIKNDSFTTVWNDDNTFTLNVTTALKSQVKLFVSDYVLTSPAYKGGCFSRDASTGTYPQTWFKTANVTLPKGFVGTKTVSVDLPTGCENVQVDLYTGNEGQPLNGSVTSAGHDNYGFITGNIMLTAKNPACVDTPTPPTGGQGGGTTTPTPTPTTPAVKAATTVAPTLTDTGLKLPVVSVLAAATMGAGIFVATRRARLNFDDFTL